MGACRGRCEGEGGLVGEGKRSCRGLVSAGGGEARVQE